MIEGNGVYRVRFDDSLATVLAADTATGFGAQSAWRQLVDLIARRRVPDIAAALDRLRALRTAVPVSVRIASARMLGATQPPASLVAFFAEDEQPVAATALRVATLSATEWTALLPKLSPLTRSVLRHRRDLPLSVERALESFGSTDFVLGHVAPAIPAVAPPVAVVAQPPAPQAPPPPTFPVETPFVSIGKIARELPVVAAARRGASDAPDAPRFEIADLVARIDAFRHRAPPAPPPVSAPPADQFRFETDAAGIVRWVDVVARGALIGMTLASASQQGMAQVDAAVGGALRTRSPFRGVRLEVGGESSAAGSWRLSGTPQFDRASGRFAGIVGIARRPRRDEVAAPVASASDSLRQLVHELRTPANAIAGFSELIGTELLGPVPPVYRDRAQLIGREADGLVSAIDDLDTAARLEGGAMELRPCTLDLAPLLARIVADLRPLAAERGAMLMLEAEPNVLAVADDRAAARLLDRLLTALVAMAEPGERLRLQLGRKTRTVRLHVTRPRALAAGSDDALLAIDVEAEREGGPLLGVGFTLRLVRNLAAALGGSLTIAPDRLTLRLPAVHAADVERAAAR